MSEWEHIFKGEAIDLDKILSSLHCITVDQERKARMGDNEISIGGTETKRKIESSSEWSTAWRSAWQATAFVFKHRERELADYGDYIKQLFAAKQPGAHNHVILYNRGVRNEVGEVSPCCLPTTSILHPSTPPQCRMMGSSTSKLRSLVEEVEQPLPRLTYATDSTVKSDADLPRQLASTGMPVRGAVRRDMEKRPAERVLEERVFGMRPKYLCYNLWSRSADPMVTASEWTLSALPLPQPPQVNMRT